MLNLSVRYSLLVAAFVLLVVGGCSSVEEDPTPDPRTIRIAGDVNGVLTASAPSAIEGLLEVRGIGIIKVKKAGFPVHLDMVIAHADAADIERIPDSEVIELADRSLPLHKIDFSAPSAAAQVRTLALIQWGLAGLSNS